MLPRNQKTALSKSVITGIAGFDAIQKELSLFLTELFDILFPVGVLFGGIALAASMYRSIHYGWYPTLFLNVGMYLTAVMILIIRRRLPPLLIFSVMLGLISIEVIHSLYYRGLASGGMMNLAIVCIFAGIFLGKRVGFIAVVTGTLVASLIGAGFSAGMLIMNIDPNDHLLMSLTWIVDISLFIMYVVCLILTVNGMQRQIVKALHESEESASRLEAEIEMRKRIERELIESAEKYRSIFDNATMGIFQSTPEGRYLNVNPSYAKLHGFDSPEQLITNVTDIESQLYVNSVDYRLFREVLDTKGIVQGYEIQRYHRTSTVVSFQ
jgi:PAS domain-containing protein